MIYKEKKDDLVDHIIREASELFDTSESAITGRCREEPLASIRNVVISVCRRDLGVLEEELAPKLNRKRSVIGTLNRNHVHRMKFENKMGMSTFVDRDYYDSYRALASKAHHYLEKMQNKKLISTPIL